MLRFAHRHILNLEGQCLQCAVFLADKRENNVLHFSISLFSSKNKTKQKRDCTVVLLLEIPSNPEMLVSTIFRLNVFDVVE